MGSDDRDSAVYAPFDAIKRHYGYLHRIKDIGEALQLVPKVNIPVNHRPPDRVVPVNTDHPMALIANSDTCLIKIELYGPAHGQGLFLYIT